MRNAILFFTAAIVSSLIAGCIVSDELTTITIQPDGSADWIRFQSNIRSTEPGAKGAQELKKFVDEFDVRSNSDFTRIIEAGGEVIESRWVRREEPSANLIKARFPTAAALEKFGTIKNDKGEVIAPVRFTQNGNRRKISLVIPVPRDEQPEITTPPSPKELREQQANGISETRIVVAAGRIVASQGFVVAADKRSCLLDVNQIAERLRSRPEQVELFIEWELGDKSSKGTSHGHQRTELCGQGHRLKAEGRAGGRRKQPDDQETFRFDPC